VVEKHPEEALCRAEDKERTKECCEYSLIEGLGCVAYNVGRETRMT
jgi:hypothetical protein